MVTLYILLAAIAVIGVLLYLYGRSRKKEGKLEAKAQASETVLDAVKEAKDVEDRLISVPGFAKRVRDRFTRK